MRKKRIIILILGFLVSGAGWFGLETFTQESRQGLHHFSLEKDEALSCLQNLGVTNTGAIESVMLSGTFSRWSTDDKSYQMKKKPSQWGISIPLSRGRHLYKFVIFFKNREKPVWIHDPGNPLKAKDNFGGLNSVYDLSAGWFREYLLPILVVITLSAFFLLLAEVFLALVRKPGTRREHRYALVLALAIIMTGVYTGKNRVFMIRQSAKQTFLDAAGVILSSFRAKGFTYQSKNSQSIKKQLDGFFYHSSIRTLGSENLAEGFSLGGCIVFSKQYEPVAVSFRKAAASILHTAAKGTSGYEKALFRPLRNKVRDLPIFGNAPQDFLKRIPDVVRDSISRLGFSLLLVPVKQEDSVQAWFGFVLLPELYAQRIRQALINTVIVFLTLLVLTLAFFLKKGAGKVVPDKETLGLLAKKYSLSPREQEVLFRLLQGESYQEMGAQLYISPKTVKSHVLSIYRKCHVRNKTALLSRISSLS